jgi:hypothetical protein
VTVSGALIVAVPPPPALGAIASVPARLKTPDQLVIGHVTAVVPDTLTVQVAAVKDKSVPACILVAASDSIVVVVPEDILISAPAFTVKLP